MLQKARKLLYSFVTMIVILSLFWSFVIVPVGASTFDRINSERLEYHQGFTLTWKDEKNLRLLLKVSKDNQETSYTYNSNGNRITKLIGDNKITYQYDDDSNLIFENRDGFEISYHYQYDMDLIGFSLEGKTYSFVKDYNRNVTGILDEAGNEIVRYEYNQDGQAISVLGKDDKGHWVEQSDDPSFIGNINMIRLHSLYLDIETGWYYNGKYYYDPANKIYLGAVVDLEDVITFEKFLESYDPTTPKLNDIGSIVTSWANSLLNTPGFGAPITDYSSGWYNNLVDVELLTRLIYAENTFNSADQNAIAWVIINRKNKNSSEFGGNTYRGVATKSGAFETITGGKDGTLNARVPDTSKSTWRQAVWLACSLLATNNMSDYAILIQKPTGISSQLYFVGLNYFMGNASRDNPSGSGIQYNFGTSAGYVDIKDIVIVFENNRTLRNPSSKNVIENHIDLNSPEKRRKHNIFFNIK